MTRGEDRLRFGELAEEAAKLSPPADIILRTPGVGGISGQSVPRIDLPSKVDGSAAFAADVRMLGLVYASVRQGPFGDTRLLEVDKKAADRIDGVIGIVENPRWVAAVATNWWAADRALDGYVLAEVGTATHYHTDWVVPYWSGSLSKVAQVDTHIFYR